MSQDVELKAQKREETGKKSVANLRNKGSVPAVVQEHGKESISITVDAAGIRKAYEQAGKSQPIDLEVGTSKKLVLIKEIEFLPMRKDVQHVVFQALKQDEVVDAVVPVHIVGEIPAENNRLVLLHTLESVEVRALPRSLPEALEVSGEKLAEINDRITVRDIKLPEGVELVELLANADDQEKQEEFLDQPIALVKEPQVEEEPESEAEEGAEGEVPAEHGSDEAAEGEATETDSNEKSE